MASQYARARRLWVGFLTAVVGLVAALAWLGWRIGVQDEQLSVARRAASAESTVVAGSIRPRLDLWSFDVAAALNGR